MLRLRNVKNKLQIIDSSDYVIKNSEENRGRWYNVFENKNPIEVEIGMGKGDFIVSKALKNPNINYVGIEKADSIVARAIQKIPKNIPNLKIVIDDAINIDNIFDKEVSIIYLNFSDPWPKKRHRMRRLTSTMFLSKYESVFESEKVICQKTDNTLLFESSIVSLNEMNYRISEISLDLHNSELENESITEYESKFSSQGNQIYYLKAIK